MRQLTRYVTHASTASDLDLVYGTVGTAAAAFVDYPISAGVPDLTNPKTTTTGTFRVPPDFACAQGDTFDSTGQLLVSGDSSSQQEPLTAIRGSCALGYSPRFFMRAKG